ncbi:hypothetical protein L1987_48260 [Smallanthus sonchifolius]|uniref:Uncharacterized protein n=1 Tax=Smallanthus sonchifolius TaxID=185202 RepID=A0ACB9FRI4_9ASTR|nr:hypothetical protein L1987_48260 [Smallanthus sonchifolius]
MLGKYLPLLKTPTETQGRSRVKEVKITNQGTKTHILPARSGKLRPTIEVKVVCIASTSIKEKKVRSLLLKRAMLTMFYTSRHLWKHPQGSQVNVITDQTAKEVVTWSKSLGKTKELPVDKKGKAKPYEEGATTRGSRFKMNPAAPRKVRFMHTLRTPPTSRHMEKAEETTPKKDDPYIIKEGRASPSLHTVAAASPSPSLSRAFASFATSPVADRGASPSLHTVAAASPSPSLSRAFASFATSPVADRLTSTLLVATSTLVVRFPRPFLSDQRDHASSMMLESFSDAISQWYVSFSYLPSSKHRLQKLTLVEDRLGKNLNALDPP